MALLGTGKFYISALDRDEHGVYKINASFVLGDRSNGIVPDAENIEVAIEPHPPEIGVPSQPRTIVSIPNGRLVANYSPPSATIRARPS